VAATVEVAYETLFHKQNPLGMPIFQQPTWNPGMDYSLPQDAHEARSETENTRRVGRRPPQRRCRKLTDKFVTEHAMEEVEEDRREADQRTLRLKEKNKRAQQRFRERQREKNKSVATQAVKLQQEVKDLRQKLAAATRPAAVVAPLPPAVVKSPEPETEVAARIEAEAFEPYTGWSTLPEEVHTILLRGQRAPQSLSRRDLLEFTPEQLTLLLKGYVEEMAVTLLDARNSAFGPSVQHLQGLNSELFALFALIHRLAPTAMMDRLRLEDHPSHLETQAICAMLREAGLTSKQVQQLVSARVLCLSTLASLMKERYALCERLEAAVSGGSSWESMRMSHASMVDLQRHLAQNVEEESNAFFTFMDSALRKVLSPVQTASLVVRSFPCLPIVFPLVPLLTDCSREDPAPFCPQPDHLRSCLSTTTSAQLPDVGILAMDTSDSLGQTLDTLWNDIYVL